MALVTYEFYESAYGAEAIPEPLFNRFLFVAENVIREAATGADNRCKLDFAFPENERDALAIKRCACELVNLANAVNEAQIKASSGGVVSSVSAGNESIHYATNAGMVGASLNSKSAQDAMYAEVAESYLRGVNDANGVGLMYKGVYPYRV